MMNWKKWSLAAFVALATLGWGVSMAGASSCTSTNGAAVCGGPGLCCTAGPNWCAEWECDY